MRKWVAKCSAALLTVTLIGLAVTCMQLVSPAPAYSRQIPSGFEDGGDPDGLDGAMSVTDEFGGLVSTPEVGAQDAGDRSEVETTLDSSSRFVFRLFGARAEQRTVVLKLWFSISSFVFTF
ncbi:MAG: hypothetical protein NTX17_04620 [Candidatus Eisenbacteria bacterium]|nr:hypothetical protein [Candidatus Eisenbacteria bacterium]